MRLRTRAFASRNYPQIPLPAQISTESQENVKNVQSKAKPAEFKSLVDEKMARLQKSVSCRKELISSMLKDVKNRQAA